MKLMSTAERLERVREGEGVISTLSVLRRRWLVIVGVVAVCLAVSVYRYERAPKTYQATASVAFQSGTLSDAALNINTGASTEPQREANTEVLIAHSPEVADGVRGQLHSSSSAAELLDQVSVEAAPSADILNVSASTEDPRTSAQLANAFASQYIAFRAKSELAGITSSEKQLEQQIAALPADSTQRAALGESLQRLGELRAVAGGGANIIGLASPPTTHSGMHFSTAIIMGLLIGLAIALAIVFLIETLDRRIKTIEDFEREYRLPALTSIPRDAFRPGPARNREELLEPYRILRSALDFAAVTRELGTLLVTSAMSGEGKTTVSVDLCHVIALTGRRVVLIELDLRRPTLSRHFKLNTNRGITDLLAHGGSAQDALIEPFPDLPNFSILPAGRLPHNPSELLGSPRLSEIITELSSSEGIVIVDAPPLNPVADTQVLLNNAAISAVLLVARVDRTTRDEARRARGILDRHIVEPLGIVITGLRETGSYGYEANSELDQTLGTDIDALSHPQGDSGHRRLSL
jgi:succinoglycan biosynthesis transport protein ExoP